MHLFFILHLHFFHLVFYSFLFYNPHRSFKMPIDFDFKLLCKTKNQAEIIIRQTVLQSFLKETLDTLKKFPKALIFLNKVGKKEAPNYSEIVKNPMDLTTMCKKLHIYRDLDEFQFDIDLIVSNCLLYNTADYYLECAREFKAEAYSLLLKYQRIYPKVPESYDISFKSPGLALSSKQDLKIGIAKYFKMVGFESCEKKCIEILCDVVAYKIRSFISKEM